MHKNRALLLDRDGVINVDHGYVGTIDRFDFISGIFPFLRAARDIGYRLAVLTNQSGVARGKYTADDHDTVTAHMVNEFRREKIDIDLTLVCFEHPEGAIKKYARESFWRKPNPGMVFESLRCLNCDPARSAFVGDNLRDMQAAQSGGIARCIWLTQKQVEPVAGVDIVANYDDALKLLQI
jgi:D-glycero-D-manno-heptose 1,7-bisphosphate phosphatase